MREFFSRWGMLIAWGLLFVGSVILFIAGPGPGWRYVYSFVIGLTSPFLAFEIVDVVRGIKRG